ncbi:hypothetical protein RN001_015051 [Aquatica leii]|uniref:Protein FAM98A n=1 Tax=Aquatica leii TaxID=1421715 RepID=A0AAN7PQ54_9COLE|nr:hypothetical protein RN001_015051 [Aquatica leii]
MCESEAVIVANLEELTICDVSDVSKIPVAEFNSPEATTKMTLNQAELLKSIENIGYKGSLESENQLSDALENGAKSIEFTRLIGFLTTELRELCSLDECVTPITAPEDSITFLMELSSFLNELGCPHSQLTQGHVSERLGTVEDRVLLVEHLISELMAARILREDRPEKRIDLKLRESSQAGDLRKILQILGFSKPPPNITMTGLFQKITPAIQKLVEKAHKDLVGNPMFNGNLSDKQWELLEKVQQELHDEYLIRREMLLKRLDCTIQSFQWSGRTKGKDTLFEKTYTEKRKTLKAEPEVDISDLLASREDLAIIEKTSSASVRKNTKSSINRVIIGPVPDRGGRTSEQQPPPPEMPPWQQRNAGPSGGQFNRGGGNFSRGGGDSRGGRGRGSNSSSFESAGRGYNSGSFDSAGSYGGRGGAQRGTEYSRGGNSYSRGGGGSDYSRGGNNYSRDAQDSRSESDYSRGGNNYSGGGNNYSGGGSDYNRSYSSSDNYNRSNSGSDYSKGGSSYTGGGSSYAGGGNNYSRSDSYNQGNSGYSQSSSSYSQSNRNSGGGYDSAGSYGGYSQDYQEPKRAKTYDQFQQSRDTYADQYVQESQHNKQYQSRDRDNRGQRGGRSNYNRGGGSYR